MSSLIIEARNGGSLTLTASVWSSAFRRSATADSRKERGRPRPRVGEVSDQEPSRKLAAEGGRAPFLNPPWRSAYAKAICPDSGLKAGLQTRLFLLVSSLLLPFIGSASDSLRAGPLFDEFPLTLATGQRTEAAGPFYYSEQKETQHT